MKGLKLLTLSAFLSLVSPSVYAGAFYTNMTVIGPERDAVVQHMKKTGLTAYVSVTEKGRTVVCEKKTDTQDTAYARKLCIDMSKELKCVIIFFLNHDSDILVMQVFSEGKQIFDYDSCPGYFDEGRCDPRIGDPASMLKSLKKEGAGDALLKVLKADSYVFAEDRQAEIVKVLDLSPFSLGLGYNYAENLYETEQEVRRNFMKVEPGK